ncbi:MAG: FtsX-like permease family protein [Planctomycetes bacterium]|nr:FtsX-like permease family protein [Planctomycetota bacterium]
MSLTRMNLSAAFCTAWLLLPALALHAANAPKPIGDKEWQDGQLSPEKIREHVEQLSKLTSRVAGYPGAEQARDYIVKCLGGMGYADGTQDRDEPAENDLFNRVGSHRFWGLTPVDKGNGRLKFTSTPLSDLPATLPVYAVWPNGGAVTSTGPQGLTGPLLYGHTGKPEDFDGMKVSGAIVMLDLTAQTDWTIAAGLGAQAVLLVEPADVRRPDMENLYLNTPVEFPRLWLRREHGENLKRALEANTQAGQPAPEVNVYARMTWENNIWENLYLLVPGKDGPGKDTVILSAYYDSNSIVPALAPGAEQALSCATLLEVARSFKAHPPERDTLLLFCAGHFQGLKGEREFFAEIEKLPKADSDQKLYTLRTKRLILQDMARRFAEGGEQALASEDSRARLLAMSEESVKEVDADADAKAAAYSVAEAQNQHKYSWAGITFGILLVFFGIYALLRIQRGRTAIATVSFSLGAIVLLMLVGLPMAKQHLRSAEKIADGPRRLEDMLNLIKEEVATQETAIERKIREKRGILFHKDDDTAEAAADAGDVKALEEQLQQLRDRRLAYEHAGRLLYINSASGHGQRPPEDPHELWALIAPALKTAQARIRKELDWAVAETDRRERNRPFKALIDARLPSAEKATERKDDENRPKIVFLTLDLSAGSPALGAFYSGAMYNKTIDGPYSNFGKQVSQPIAEAVERRMGVEELGTLIANTMKYGKDTDYGERHSRLWYTYLPTELALAAEVGVQATIRSLTFATTYDHRMVWDTPQDDGAPERLNWANVRIQAQMAGPLLRRYIGAEKLLESNRFSNIKNTGLCQVTFHAVRRGGTRSLFPNVPVDQAVFFKINERRNAAGVRLPLSEMTNPLGNVVMNGLVEDYRVNIETTACDPDTGEIVAALNKAKQRIDVNNSFSFIGKRMVYETVELCRVQGLAILDVLDPGRLVVLKKVNLLAAQTESRPLEFGSSHPYDSEPHRVVFAEPNSRIKCLFSEGQFGVRLALLGVPRSTLKKLLDPAQAGAVEKSEARGPGVKLGTRKVVDWLPLRTATDLWSISAQRLLEMQKHSIGNAKLYNPAYPGPYSSGTVTVQNGDATVRGQGTAWDEGVVNLPFKVLGVPGAYRVEELKADGSLRLDRGYEGLSVAGAKFVLSSEEPGLHNLARQRLEEALAARAAGRVSESWRKGMEAWSIESRAFPGVLGTANDSVMGVVFYLFLLLPFCFFLERLILACKKIERQIAAFFAMFTSVFALLWFVHPAFNLVAAPPIILLAFIIMTLAGIVIAIVYGKFNSEMHLMQAGMQGVQSADVNRASAAVVAVSLGISQMRRRKFRTFLTALTVVLLTFTALSFTSLVPSLGTASIDLSPGNEKDAPYQGILLRQLNWDPMRTEAYDQFERVLAADGIRCAPRFWFNKWPTQDEKSRGQTPRDRYFDLVPEDRAGDPLADAKRVVSLQSLLGLSPQERQIFRTAGKDPIQDAMVAGEWLADGERDVCLLPLEVVEALQLGKPEDEAWRPDHAIGKRLRLGSYTVTLKGIFNAEKFAEITDLDGEQLTPVDYTSSESSRGAQETSAGAAGVENLSPTTLQSNIHVMAAQTVIVPWQMAALLGGELRAVAARVDDPAHLSFTIDRLLKLLEKNVFVGQDGRRRIYASTGKTSLAGLENLIVPLLISVLIILNTMIGAVYEREREITIFSALGLSPSHISALFLAEAFVYATLGALLGYLLGQGVAKFIQVWGEQLGIGGLYLNYSSSSAVFVTAIVMLSVLASTIYPAIRAARAASPSEERSWSVPAPVGNEISLELPFSFQRDLVPGVALFLHEFFDNHAESTVGKFTAREVTLEAFHTDQGQGVCLFFLSWLSPYDLGVSQEAQLYIVPTDQGLYISEASFFRISGHLDAWQRVNLPFLNALRKHLLIWRTYSPEQRHEYSLRGYLQFQEAFEAVGWPPPEGLEPGEPDPDLVPSHGPNEGPAGPATVVVTSTA